ncbi:unnamed protein product [Closterium sp. NIES-65]|nr:unnamed protein product [Closterium sp. NIES-65]
MGKPKARPATWGAGKGKASATQPRSNKAARPASAGRTRLRLQGQAGPPEQTRQAVPKAQGQGRGQPRGSQARSQSGGGTAATPPRPTLPLTAPRAASPRSAPPAALGSREAGRARTTGASSKSPRASRVARRETEAHQEPPLREEAGQEASPVPTNAAQGDRHRGTDGTTAGQVLTEGFVRAGEETEEHGIPRGEAAADRRAMENDGVEFELAVAVLPSMGAAGRPLVADVDVPAAETEAIPMSAGGPAAAFDGGSVLPSAIPRDAQTEVEETRLGADLELIAEVALSASPAPVTPTVLVAAVSAAIGERGHAPMVEGASSAAACAETPVAVVAASRQEHGQAEGEFAGPASGVYSGAAQRAHRSSLLSQREVREEAEAGSRPLGNTRGAPALNASPATVAYAEAPNTTNAIAHNTRHATRRAAITWGPPRGGRTPWLPAGRGAMGEGTRVPTGTRRTQRGVGAQGARGGRGRRALVGGSEILVRTGTWRERHDRPEAVEVPMNEEQTSGSEDNTGDPEFMCGEEAESEEVSLEEETGVDRNAPYTR